MSRQRISRPLSHFVHPLLWLDQGIEGRYEEILCQLDLFCNHAYGMGLTLGISLFCCYCPRKDNNILYKYMLF